MCGRFTLTLSDIAAMARAWGAEVDAALLASWRPRFNVAPGQLAPLLRGPAGARRLVAATFGLPAARGGLHVNARVETAGQRPAFRDALVHGRAAVPIDGFFEWEGPPAGRRPTWFHGPGEAPLLLAALAVDGAAGPTFAVLTTDSVEPVVRLHDRMPVVLPPGQVDAWLAEGPAPALAPAVPGYFRGRRVSPRANSPANDDPGCLDAPAPPAQGSLF